MTTLEQPIIAPNQNNTRTNPYVGPRSFKLGEQIYGRNRELTELLDLLIAERIVLLYSPSGAGKTSLTQAALIPALENEGFRVLPIMRVSNDIAENNSSTTTATNRHLLSCLVSLEETLLPDEQKPLDELANTSFEAYLNTRPRLLDDDRGEVLIFDQFEEIITIDPNNRAAKQAFFTQVGQALRNRNRWALFSMREDYIASLDPYLRWLPTRLATTFRLDLLEVDGALQAMREPARQMGVEFDTTAAQKLIDDLRRVKVQQLDGSVAEQLGAYIEPVQLQVVCRRLWDQLDASDNQITLEDLAKVGDVDNALAGYYRRSVEDVAVATQTPERTIRDWCEQSLISKQGIRGQVLQGPEQSNGLNNAVIGKLINTHLVRSDKRRGATWYELAHDRLIRPVQRDNLRWREANFTPLQRQAKLWDEQSRSDGLLLRDRALADAEAQLKGSSTALTEVEQAFLDRCRQVRTNQQRLRLTNRIIQGLGIFAVLASIISVYFFFQARQQAIEAENKAQLANASELANIALVNLQLDPERSVLLAREAAAMTIAASGVVSPQTYNILQQALHELTIIRTFRGHTSAVTHVVLTNNDTRLFTSSLDSTIRIWDVATGQALRQIPTQTDYILFMDVTSDGQLIALDNSKSEILLIDANTGQIVQTLRGHPGPISDLDFSPDGKLLASSDINGTTIIWDVAQGQPIHQLQGHISSVSSVVFDPTGSQLATGGDDFKVIIWDVQSGTMRQELIGHFGVIMDIAFSPDGSQILTGSTDFTARLWQVSDGTPIQVFSEHGDWVRTVAFDPQHSRIITGSDDTTIRLFDVQNGLVMIQFNGHTRDVYQVAMTADGNQIVSAGGDMTARLWNAPVDHREGVNWVNYRPDGKQLITSDRTGSIYLWNDQGIFERELVGHTDDIHTVVFSPNGQQALSASSDGTARIWDIASGEEVLQIVHNPDSQGLLGRVFSAIFNPDGSQILTAGEDGFIRFWDSNDGSLAGGIPSFQNAIYDLALSPDGSLVSAAGLDGVVRIWEVETGEQRLELTGHLEAINATAFHPTEPLIVTAGEDETIKVWSLSDGSLKNTLIGHTRPVTRVMFNRDGSRILSSSDDGTVRIWDAETGIMIDLLEGHRAGVSAATYNLDGTLVATSSLDRRLRLFVLNNPDLLLAEAQRRVTRKLTPTECLRYSIRSSLCEAP
jgi:WD40 repeat protein